MSAIVTPPEKRSSGDVVIIAPKANKNNTEVQNPIPLSTKVLKSISTDIFPKWFSEMVDAVSASTETPPELAYMMGLAVVATVVQKKIRIEPSAGYEEPLNVWCLVMMDSGNRKSGVIKQMAQVLTYIEKEKIEQMEADIFIAEESNLAIDELKDDLRKKRKKEKYAESENDITEQIANLELKRKEVPVKTQLWCQDITPEKLGAIMASQGEKMTILSAEGGVLDHGRYNAGTPNIDIYLQSHAGDAVRVDRGSREQISMDCPTLTLGLCPQPSILTDLAEKPVFRGRGFLARFLYVLPTTLMGYRQFNAAPVHYKTTKQYEDKIKLLADVVMVPNDEEQIKPHVITLSPESTSLWRSFALEIESLLRDGNRLQFMRDWAGKLPGAAARVAGLMHCMEHAGGSPWDVPVHQDTVKNALALSRMLLSHAEKAFDLMGSDESLKAARDVWSWIERKKLTEFTERDCHYALKGKYKTKNKLKPAFLSLVEHNYIEPKPRDKNKPGRPPSKYTVNHKITAQWE